MSALDFSRAVRAVLVIALLAFGCSESNTPGDGGGDADGGGTTDGGAFDGGGTGVCPGYTAPPAGATSCHMTSECPPSTMGDTFCVPTDYVPPPLCGGPGPPPTCTTDADCEGTGLVRCAPSPVECWGPRVCESACIMDADCEAGTRCLPDGTCEPLACPTDFECPADYRCDATAELADQNGCEPIPCDDGYTCADGEVCDAMRLARLLVDEHGCRPPTCDVAGCPENYRCDATPAGYLCQQLPCTADGDCDCGACVESRCASGPGYCYVQPPPPP